MNDMPLLVDFTQSATLLLALAIGYVFVIRHLPGRPVAVQLVNGALFGFAAVVAMSAPVDVVPGVIFDARSVVLGVAGLFGGPWAALCAGLVAGLFRVALGGVGVPAGVGVIVICAALGVVYRHMNARRRERPGAGELYLYGLVLHGVVLAWGLLTLPDAVRWQVLEAIAPPTLVVFPVATLLLAKLLHTMEEWLGTERVLGANERTLRQALMEAPFPLIMHTEDGAILLVNRAWTAASGYDAAELPDIDAWTRHAYGAGADAVRAQIRALFQGAGRVEEGEFAITAKGGERLVWQFSSAPLGLTPDGRRVRIAMAADVTGRKRAERELAERIEILESIFDNAPVMICLIAPDGRVKFVNAEFERVLGWRREEICADPDIFEKFYPDPGYRRWVTGFIQAGARSFAEFRTQSRSGRVVPTRFANVLLRDGTSIGIGIDMSAQVRAEQDLRELEARFRATFEQAAVGMAMMGLDGRMQRVNRRLCEILGYGERELLARAYADIADPDHLPAHRSQTRRLVDGEIDAYRLETRCVRRSGAKLWVNLTVALVRGTPERPGYLVAVVEDIEARKRAEAEAQAAHTRLRQFFEQPLTGMATTSPEKGWLEVNDRLCQLLGYPREALVRKTWAELTHPADLAADVAEFERVLRGESEGYAMDKRFIRQDGSVLWASIAVRVVRTPDGEVDYFVALVNDLSERMAGAPPNDGDGARSAEPARQ